MAVFGSLLFNRSLKQFLASTDLRSEETQALIEKIRSQANDNLEKLLETIPGVDGDHGEILREICQDELGRDAGERFLNKLDSGTTVVRSVAKDLLSESQRISPAKLFNRLHDETASLPELIDILEFQKKNLPPEQIIKNALRMEKQHAVRLIEIARTQAERTNMAELVIDIEELKNPDIKMKLIRFLAAVNQPEAAKMLSRFLGDPSKIIVIETLKNLRQIDVEFDPACIVRFIPDMRDEDREVAFEILRKRASRNTLPGLTMLMTGQSDELRQVASKIVVDHADEASLETLLLALDVHEWWGKEQALKSLLTLGDNRFFTCAAALVKHENEFVKTAAEQLSANLSSQNGELTGLMQSLMHENWQVRERAIQSVGKTGKREALVLLMKVVREYPESSIAVLKAVAQLGFSKGLEITSLCLQMKEAAIQREALRTTDAITTERHAANVRDGIVKMVPKLQVTVRDTAQKVIQNVTEKFGLPELEMGKEMFETRLLKIEEQKSGETMAAAATLEAAVVDSTPSMSFQYIEDLKQGDYWMDRYRIEREVGRGAMGRVMLAEDETVGEEVILKFMHPELTTDAKARERFLRELKYSRKISHPNVIRIHDFLIKDGISAISMEYFESRGLDDLIKNELLESPEQSLQILFQVCDGMYEAHQKNVIHRDLKPSNILVNDDGVAKVVDFGIASATSETEATLTNTGMIIGTPAYLSPERAKGLEADHRSDIYALGIIAYTMFSGSPPYKGEPMSLLFQHIEGKALPLHRANPDIKIGISMLVEKMMATDIERRYQSMKDVRDTIRELM